MDYQMEGALAKEFYDDCLSTLLKKANDYASEQDCFSNFKMISQICKMPIEKAFMQFLAVKISRLSELVGEGKEAKNESVEDTLKDLTNYACLMAVFLKEVKNEN